MVLTTKHSGASSLPSSFSQRHRRETATMERLTSSLQLFLSLATVVHLTRGSPVQSWYRRLGVSLASICFLCHPIDFGNVCTEMTRLCAVVTWPKQTCWWVTNVASRVMEVQSPVQKVWINVAICLCLFLITVIYCSYRGKSKWHSCACITESKTNN